MNKKQLYESVMNNISNAVKSVLNEKYGVPNDVEKIYDIFVDEYKNGIDNTEKLKSQLCKNSYLSKLIIKRITPVNYKNNKIYFLEIENDINEPIACYLNNILCIQYQEISKNAFKVVLQHEIRHLVDDITSNLIDKKNNDTEDTFDKKYSAYKYTFLFNYTKDLSEIKRYMQELKNGYLYDIPYYCSQQNMWQLWILEPLEHAAMLAEIPHELNMLFNSFDNQLYQTIILYIFKKICNFINKPNINDFDYLALDCISQTLRLILFDSNSKRHPIIGIVNIINLMILYKQTDTKKIDPFADKIFNMNMSVLNLAKLITAICIKYNVNSKNLAQYINLVNQYQYQVKNEIKIKDFMKKQYLELLSVIINKEFHNYCQKYFYHIEKIISDFIQQHPFEKYIVKTQDEYNDIRNNYIDGIDNNIVEMLLKYIELDNILDISNLK